MQPVRIAKLQSDDGANLPFTHGTPRFRWWSPWVILPLCSYTGRARAGRQRWCNRVGEPRGYLFISFDDDVARAAAESDPAGFVAGLPDRVILDEVQRVPSLFTSLKQEIDRFRVPGRFLLTGSSQVLLMPMLSDSLAGRLEVIHLHPLSQCEIEGGIPNFLDDLFWRGFETSNTDRLGDDLAVRIASGGYPAALTRPTFRRRAGWYRNHVETQLQRDVRDMSRIRSLDLFPRLLTAAAAQTASLYNLSRPVIAFPGQPDHSWRLCGASGTLVSD